MRINAYVYCIEKMDECIKVFKALSDTKRLKIIWLLTNIDEKVCVSEIVEVLDEYQYNVSRHLRILKEANLISDVGDGKWVYYNLTPITSEFRHLVQEAIKAMPTAQMKKEINKCKSLLAKRDN
ncbi:metalloregulator ArsR/SmtB family transcription factor [Arenibacter sp. F20364]|uniref:Arsenic resistance transcriptional regulator ArsR2 n=2 Tax=Flavobacteriaceae TaxID=49546 RepID=A0AC61Y7P7_9FLAO|nr:Arsenic resistance transcriptional regulator ArsR2 [Mesonia oceanica]|tara:strand:+ start:367 stop:738 length:372 start_codon:yes stop_codon:yes gene_type:complete